MPNRYGDVVSRAFLFALGNGCIDRIIQFKVRLKRVHFFHIKIDRNPNAFQLTDRFKPVHNFTSKAANAFYQQMSALEDEAVKALTGESKLDISFINGLIPKRRATLEKATEELARLRGVIAETEKKNASINQELKIILSWADAFDSASTDVKRSIISALIDRITVYDDCSLDIHFRISAEQFLGKAA